VRFLDVSGRMTERSARVEGRLDTKRWRVGGLMLPCTITMAAAGEIDMGRRNRPRFFLEGEATLVVFGATVKGQGRISGTRSGGVDVAVAGALSWQGRGWIGGRIELRPQGVTIGGRTSLAFNLTPSTFAGVDVASLFFTLDIEGEFTLDVQGGLSAFGRLQGDWMLAVQFPNADSSSVLRRQAFPIAMRRFAVKGGVRLEKKLLEIRSMRLLPANLPLPSIEVDDEMELRFHRHGIDDVPVMGDLRVYLPEIPGVHTPDMDTDPYPLLLDEDVSKKWVTAATIPTSFKLGNGTLSLPASLNFDVYLVWNAEQGRLAIDVRPV
jgi:hypothetical protein